MKDKIELISYDYKLFESNSGLKDLNDIKSKLFNDAKELALKNNIKFLININDIVIPEKCPLLEIEFSNSSSDNNPYLDRIDYQKGFVNNNIFVISNKAHNVRQDLSIHTLKLLVDNLEQKIISQKISEDRRSNE